WLASGPEARAAFWAEAQTHALLREAAQEAQGRRKAVLEIRPRRRRPQASRRSLAPLWIAAACALAAVGLSLALTKQPPSFVNKPGPAAPPVKMLPPPVAALGQVERATGTASAKAGTPIVAGTEIVTADGRVELALADGTRVRVDEDTEVVVESGSRLRLARGGIEAVIPSGRDRLFASPTAEARVLGTVLRLSAEGPETALHVDEGRVRFTRLRDGASVEVAAGHLAVAKPDGPLVAVAATTVVALQVVDHRTRQVLETLRDGMTLRLKGRPPVALIAATAGPAPGCVVFDYEGQRGFNTERAAPFGLVNGDAPWAPSPGAHVVTATPYSGPPAAGKRGGTGVPGRALTVRFTVE
ncbi:MAG TPA: FecR family protein, partial [Planctomycetota bacterium]|nr:FecR family protein [Planctomycetota bacterium]